MKLDVAISEVRDAETEVAQNLNVLGERHTADHDVFHTTETLQRLARSNLEALASLAERYDVPVDVEDAPTEHQSGLPDKARERASELLGRRPESGLLLLRDLRRLHLLYAEASIDWVAPRPGSPGGEGRRPARRGVALPPTDHARHEVDRHPPQGSRSAGPDELTPSACRS